jgi:hypothetical protein
MDKLSTLKSPEDGRDYIMETIISYNKPLPSVFDMRNKLKPIRNQGSMGTCAAMTGACIKEYQERTNINFRNYFSAMFIYNNRSNQETDGMYGRDVMKILANKGICPEKDMKYGTIMKPSEIPEHIYDICLNYKIKAYARINTIDGLKKSLILYGPCYIAFPCYSKNINMWKPLFRGQQYNGGHAMTIVGYNYEGFILRNSWGVKWGDRGYCIYPYKDFGHHWEIWTLLDDESYYNSDDDCIYEINNKKFCCI